MGLYSLRMQFDGTFARDRTPLVDEYQAIIEHGSEVVGEMTWVPAVAPVAL